jgi:hypothetical protein
MAYQYESLAHPEYEIRVAVLQPGEFIDDVQVKFVVRNLNVRPCALDFKKVC